VQPSDSPTGDDRTTSYLEHLLIDYVMLSPSLMEHILKPPTIYALDQGPEIGAAEERLSDHRPFSSKLTSYCNDGAWRRSAPPYEKWCTVERYRSLFRLSRKAIAGIVLIALALATLAAVPLWTVREGFIDFPCESGRSPTASSTFPPEQRRISYCISSWPRNVFGGSVYAHGESNRDEVILTARHFWHGDITLQRDGAPLVVNGRRLAELLSN
jgi:hypothetical protein